MAGIAIGLVWLSYGTMLYGYCLFRGYNVTPKQLLDMKTWPPGTKAAKKVGSTKPASTTPTTPTNTNYV